MIQRPTELLDRVPPHSLAAEAAVIASVVLLPSMLDEVLPIVTSDDFYGDDHGLIFEAISDIHDQGRPLDLTLLVEQLRDSGDYERVGGAAGIMRLMQAAEKSTATNAVYHATIVRDTSRRRKVIDAAIMAIRDCHNDGDIGGTISTLSSSLDSLSVRQSCHLADSHDIASRVIDNYEARKAGQLDTVTTGLPALDRIIGGGFAKTDYVVIGARTSYGKTSLALSLVSHISRDTTRQALLVSIEMSRDEIADRLAASLGELPTLQLRLGDLSRDGERQLTDVARTISDLSFVVDDSPTQTVAGITRTARREYRRKPLSCVVVDYLQLLEATKKADRRDMELAQMSRKFKALAQELCCPVICLAQLNKEAEGVRPRMSHIREADSISHEANVVLLLDRPDFHKTRPPGEGEPCTLIVDKNRNGPRGVSVPLYWFDRFTQFVEAAPKRITAFDSFNEGR